MAHVAPNAYLAGRALPREACVSGNERPAAHSAPVLRLRTGPTNIDRANKMLAKDEQEQEANLATFMREAIAQGKLALPACLPNPPVGCVLVRGGVIIARGYTQPPYQPHAEPMALR